MAPSPPSFVQAVMDALGCQTDADLVATMGWRATATSNISKWRRGLNAPDFEATWEMLAAAGWLSDGATQLDPASARSAAAVEARRAEENARALADRKEPARDRRKSA